MPRVSRLASRVSRLTLGFLLPALLFLACTATPPARSAPGRARWISLSPSMTEILFSVGAGPEVVGVCSPSTFPPEAATLPQVASWDRLDVERVLALAPSACFTVEGMQPPQSLESLNRMRVEVVAYPMRSLDDLWSCMEDVGRRTGHAGQAGEVVSALKARVALAGSGLTGSPRRALVVVGLDPLVAAGPGSFLSQVLRAAGYENALTGAGDAYPVLSMEAAVAADPEAVVFPEGEIPPKDCARFVEDLRSLTARPLQFIAIPADLLVRPGPRTVDAVERLAAARRQEAGSGERGAGSREQGDNCGECLARPLPTSSPTHLLTPRPNRVSLIRVSRLAQSRLASRLIASRVSPVSPGGFP
jgi:iron complex transport system substrate-binding protein